MNPKKRVRKDAFRGKVKQQDLVPADGRPKKQRNKISRKMPKEKNRFAFMFAFQVVDLSFKRKQNDLEPLLFRDFLEVLLSKPIKALERQTMSRSSKRLITGFCSKHQR